MLSVIIIGGGMVGATLALALANLTNNRIHIDLVEKSNIKKEKYNHPYFKNMVIALSQGTCKELDNIGLWSIFSTYTTQIKQVEISNNYCNLSKTLITSSDYNIPALGYVFELNNTWPKLIKILKNVSCIHLHSPAIFNKIIRGISYNSVILDNGYHLRSKLIIAADGSYSPLATRCGMSWKQKDYQQIAIIANIFTDIPNNNCAFEKFTKDGSIGLLPLSEYKNYLVWCLPDNRKQEFKKLNSLQFCKIFKKTFGSRLGSIIEVSQHNYYPIKLLLAERHIAHRLALVGNAAQTLHPIAGQGLNIGLRDAITLAKILAKAIIKGEDIGDYSVLNSYQALRQSDQAKIVKITDGLVYLFKNNSFPLVLMRNIGLLSMNYIPTLRNLFILKMLGLIER